MMLNQEYHHVLLTVIFSREREISIGSGIQPATGQVSGRLPPVRTNTQDR